MTRPGCVQALFSQIQGYRLHSGKKALIILRVLFRKQNEEIILWTTWKVHTKLIWCYLASVLLRPVVSGYRHLFAVNAIHLYGVTSIPNIYLGLGFEFGLERIRDLAIVGPKFVLNTMGVKLNQKLWRAVNNPFFQVDQLNLDQNSHDKKKMI